MTLLRKLRQLLLAVDVIKSDFGDDIPNDNVERQQWEA